jgi:hypothetical protein
MSNRLLRGLNSCIGHEVIDIHDFSMQPILATLCLILLIVKIKNENNISESSSYQEILQCTKYEKMRLLYGI